MAVGMMHRKWQFLSSSAPLAAGLVALGVAWWVENSFNLVRTGPTDYVSFTAGWWSLMIGTIFAVILHGLLVMERRVTVPSGMIALGAASYVLYLVHTPANSFLQLLALRLPNAAIAAGAGDVLLIVGGLAAGFSFHYFIEKPLTRRLRSLVEAKPRSVLRGNTSVDTHFPSTPD